MALLENIAEGLGALQKGGRQASQEFLVGLEQGEAGKKGVNLYNKERLPGKVSLKMNTGDTLTIKTPGGGGFGKPIT